MSFLGHLDVTLTMKYVTNHKIYFISYNWINKHLSEDLSSTTCYWLGLFTDSVGIYLNNWQNSTFWSLYYTKIDLTLNIGLFPRNTHPRDRFLLPIHSNSNNNSTPCSLFCKNKSILISCLLLNGAMFLNPFVSYLF